MLSARSSLLINLLAVGLLHQGALLNSQSALDPLTPCADCACSGTYPGLFTYAQNLIADAHGQGAYIPLRVLDICTENAGSLASLAEQLRTIEGNLNPFARILYGKFLLLQGYDSAALQQWQQIRGADRYFAFQGEGAFHRGETHKALSYFSWAEQIDSSETHSKWPMYNILCDLFFGNQEYRDLIQAQAYCEKYAAAHSVVGAHLTLGQVYYERGSFTEALIEFEQAKKLRPDLGVGYTWAGNVHLKQGNLALAESAFYEAIEHEPNYPWAYIGLAYVYLEQDKIDDAVKQLMLAKSLGYSDVAKIADDMLRNLKE